MTPASFQQLYYITHVDNVASILRHGILSHERIQQDNIDFVPIYDEGIVSSRGQKTTPAGKTLWEYASTYFQARNAMLFRVVREKSVDDICVLSVRPNIVNEAGVVITTGNAASNPTEFLSDGKGVKAIPRIVKKTDKEWWSAVDGSKREMMAEVLVPDSVPPDAVTGVYVGSQAAYDKARRAAPAELPVINQPHMFFEPSSVVELDPLLRLVQGDLFFSGLQTLTISVNTVGVMGKGLASTAKYRFPDVYVRYQDVCRNKSLRMGKPYLVKRETSFDEQLADEPDSFSNGTPATWFLLFATKDHWKQDADMKGIEEGLRWLRDRYKRDGITSIALPALGCGLGKLRWREVGPLMCRYLQEMTIPTWIYLPAEKDVTAEERTRDFLLGDNSKPVQMALAG